MYIAPYICTYKWTSHAFFTTKHARTIKIKKKITCTCLCVLKRMTTHTIPFSSSLSPEDYHAQKSAARFQSARATFTVREVIGADGVFSGSVKRSVISQIDLGTFETPNVRVRLQVNTTFRRSYDLVFVFSDVARASNIVLRGEQIVRVSRTQTTLTTTVPANLRFVRVLSSDNRETTYTLTAQPLLPPKKYALVIGISDYTDNAVNDLRFCDEDATEWCTRLKARGYDTVLLGDGTSTYGDHVPADLATEFNIRKHINEIAAKCRIDDTFVFVCSSHGARDSRSRREWVCCLDFNGTANGQYTDLEFAADVRNVVAAGAKFVAILDLCHSGGIADELVAVDPKSVCVLSTASATGYGYDVFDYSHGAWTYHLIRALAAIGDVQNVQHLFREAIKTYPFRGRDAPNIKGNVALVF